MAVEASLLRQVIADQAMEHRMPASYFARTVEAKLEALVETKEILVLSGIRRCGKSVLMQWLRERADESNYYFNFEDERLVNFSIADFQTLRTVFIEMFGVQKCFYFDEIQNIAGWELFVRRLYNADNKIVVTGSNANLFSEELGTRLTGRYIPISIYPMSFEECVRAKGVDDINNNYFSTVAVGQLSHFFNQYLQTGGIPEYVKYEQVEYLQALYESILYRDIIARYGISDDVSIRKLIFFLASNCSKETTFNALRKLLEFGSTTTVSKYCSYLENSYLCFFVSRYSDSVKAQLASPKKVYFIDHTIARTLGFRFSDDLGRMFENIVFIELKRRGYDIYYHREKKECDFILRQGVNTVAAIQVCSHMSDPATKKREVAGLLEALKRFSLQSGYILTESIEACEEHEGYKIHIVPLWKWLLQAHTEEMG